MKHLIPTPAFAPVRADLDRLFERFFDDGGFSGGEGKGLVAIDVAELTDAYQVRAEVPGIDADSIDLKLDGRTLSISGEKARAFDDAADQVIHRETGFGPFRRNLQFPLAVDGDGVVARYEHGVLFITVPKAQAARSRTIEIQREG